MKNITLLKSAAIVLTFIMLLNAISCTKDSGNQNEIVASEKTPTNADNQNNSESSSAVLEPECLGSGQQKVNIDGEEAIISVEYTTYIENSSSIKYNERVLTLNFPSREKEVATFTLTEKQEPNSENGSSLFVVPGDIGFTCIPQKDGALILEKTGYAGGSSVEEHVYAYFFNGKKLTNVPGLYQKGLEGKDGISGQINEDLTYTFKYEPTGYEVNETIPKWWEGDHKNKDVYSGQSVVRTVNKNNGTINLVVEVLLGYKSESHGYLDMVFKYNPKTHEYKHSKVEYVVDDAKKTEDRYCFEDFYFKGNKEN